MSGNGIRSLLMRSSSRRNFWTQQSEAIIRRKNRGLSYPVHLPHASVIERAWRNVFELVAGQDFIHNPRALHEIKI
jgi:hypothetical protein